jgi:YD repeat-containing protein
MFKRLMTITTMIATSTFFLNGIARANLLATYTTLSLAKERKQPCAPCAAAAAQANSLSDPLDNLATLGLRTQPLPFTPIQRSTFDGATVNLVGTATGHLAFAATDLEVSGSMPVMFQRVYASDSTRDTGLGVGWSFIFDDRISLGMDAATLSTGSGSLLAFRRDGQSQRFVLKTDEATLHQSFTIKDENTIVESAAGLTHTYQRLGSTYRLSRIADSNGNTITISFDAVGNIARIANSSGGAITLEWSNDRGARILAVSDNTKRRVSFRQDAARLRAVTDSSGAEWAYNYQSGRLTQAEDPLDRVLLRARYDKAGRVVEAGDGAGTSLYEYEFTSAGVSRRTVVMDSTGVKTNFEHTERGALAAITDDEGQAMLRIDYTAANRPARIANALSGETVFAYDAENRVVRQTAGDGAYQSYVYDERGQVSSLTTNAGRTDYTRDARGQIVLAKSNNPAESYQATHDSRGQLTTIKADAGSEISFEYDASGNTSAFTVARSGRFETEYDGAGRVISRHLPSGALYHYQYDARGMIARQSDNRGRAVTFERDASGALTGIVTASGTWMRATRDQAGRVIALNTSAGKSRRFAYDGRGALTDYTDARGTHKRLGYDRRGRLQTINADDGSKTVIERDQRGRISSLKTVRGEDGPRIGQALVVKPKLGFAQFAPASFNLTASPAVSLPLQSTIDCFFMNSDEFIDSLTGFTIDFGLSCNDPFGDFGSYNPFGGLGGGGGGSGFFDPTGETCEQCKVRQQQICARRRTSCTAGLFQRGMWSGIGCTSLVIATGGLGLLICGGILFGGAGLGGVACQMEYEACVLEIIDKCPQCG